jgi:hypothetical protein
LNTVNVKLARSDDFGIADAALCTQTGQNTSLAALATRQCTATISLTPSDITAKAVTIRAGATSATVNAAQTDVTLKLGVLQATVAAGARTNNKIAVKVNITNIGPGSVDQVVLALPNNVSFAALSPCSPNITRIAAGSFQECDLEYSVATANAISTNPPSVAIWDVVQNTLALAINASSADLQQTPLAISPLPLSLNKRANLTVRVTVGEVTASGEWKLSGARCSVGSSWPSQCLCLSFTPPPHTSFCLTNVTTLSVDSAHRQQCDLPGGAGQPWQRRLFICDH